MAYLGLVPSEHSSGAKRRQGAITKAGSPLARRMLVEGAWTYRLPARVSAQMKPRLAGLPREVRETAWKGQVRLCARYRRLQAAGKRPGLALGKWRAVVELCDGLEGTRALIAKC
ncbi:hypothetical protein D6Z83_27465 [Pseudoroseomonas wenyumeiae]|uniref:Transposase IS116/IS110/IS902 C-terminal domain-containing protein n=1 Tax=Teichococcus wenyumeiae TaxID=2478470 RepID=A0A3A9J2Q2_9PROT|nr:hypothetical protein D6Z83_27465 [Pseudoroseomonas wenyumeiae]